MYIAQQERPPFVPPLAMDRLPSHQQRSTPYSTPSSATAPVLPNLPHPPPAALSTSTMDGGRIYTLSVVQQPIRARMCGFGDKDRRPITPPPCIRLIVLDAKTHKEVDITEIDTSYFILGVDLWSMEGTKEVNLVRHSATSPSISAATSSSYPPPPPTPPNFPYGPPMTQVHVGLTSNYGQQPAHQHPQYVFNPADPYHQGYQHPSNPYQQAIAPPAQPLPPAQSYYTTPSGTPITPTNYYQPTNAPAGLMAQPQLIPQSADPRSAPSGMFTRNLIGSLCVSAFKLTDPEGVMGVWFILQDLSVRTEGSFRLKMNFVNVGSPTTPQVLNNGSAPVLSSVFSDVFQVFSAKKFPGVIESTGLSKCFATQGIKIPIRKDGPRGNGRGGGDDDDE